MIISDLAHLEVIREENRIVGGLQEVSGSSSSTSGVATTGRVSVNNSSFSSASSSPDIFFSFFGPIVVGTINNTSANAFASGFTSPF